MTNIKTNIESCCNINDDDTKYNECLREKDSKVFSLPRRFTKKKCLTTNHKGFTMRSSCAPFKYCKHNTTRKHIHKITGGIKQTKNANKKTKRTYKKHNSRYKNKPQFLFNPDDPKKSFDVYINKKPEDTIPIKYKTVEDVKNTIEKLETLYNENKYTHKRIWLVAMIMMVRLRALREKKSKHYKLSKRYFDFLKERSVICSLEGRKEKVFKF